MAKFKTFLETVDRPKAGDEQAFLDKHVIATQEHPVATEFQFKGAKPPKAKRKADYDEKEDVAVYEAAEVHTKRADKEPVIVRSTDPKTGESKAKTVMRRAGEIKIGEEVELEESITKLSDARLKFHATKNVPHGSYSRKEIDAEHKRRMKTDGVSYASVKPSLNEESDLDEKVKNPYAVGMAAAMKATGDTPPLKKSTIVKGHEIAKSIKAEAMDPVGKADADINNDGKVDGSDKYLHARRKAIGKALRKEEVEQIDEISKKTLGSYVKKAASDMASNAYALGARDPLKKPGSWEKAFKRKAGIEKASDKLTKEEVEQIDEISKDLAKSYYRKASRDIGSRASSAQGSRDDAYSSRKKARDNYQVSSLGTRKTTDDDIAAHNARADRAISNAKNNERKVKNRAIGMSRASTRMEEVEQIDELSPNTLHSYIKKAAGNMAGNAAVAAAQASSSMKKSSPEVKRNIVNRMKGITGASGRLADKANMAEEVEQIDEAFKIGAMKLKDGSSVTLTRESVDALNSLFTQLNSANRSKMEERMMSSKKGFQEILSFAENI